MGEIGKEKKNEVDMAVVFTNTHPINQSLLTATRRLGKRRIQGHLQANK
jgi:hypothetical protein